ncbi:hypothetical protein D3C71_2013080 [compost metagenome]
MKSHYDFAIQEMNRNINLSVDEIMDKIRNKEYIIGPEEALGIGAATEIIRDFNFFHNDELENSANSSI